jgi:hypothetical protein
VGAKYPPPGGGGVDSGSHESNASVITALRREFGERTPTPPSRSASRPSLLAPRRLAPRVEQEASESERSERSARDNFVIITDPGHMIPLDSRVLDVDIPKIGRRRGSQW